MKRLFFYCSILLLIFYTAACGVETKQPTKHENNGKLNIYTTVYPLTYFAERIGGDYVNVLSIYPTGANEHTFEPTQKDMIDLANSDLFFYIGLGLEGFVDKTKKTLKNEHVTMVATADAISDEQLEMTTDGHEEDGHTEEDADGHEGHNHGATDPHVWISPVLSQKIALSIKNALVNADPNHKDAYEANYENLVSELKDLDSKFKEMASHVESKTFFVSHAAFGYIAAPYGLEQVAIAGLNSQDEPSQKELTKIVDLAKEHDVKYILFEQNVSSKITEIIQNEVGAKSLVMHNLGVLMKEDIQNNENYFTLMERNIETLEKALNGK